MRNGLLDEMFGKAQLGERVVKAFSKIRYSKLNARQKENFNYQWISGALATYGYHTHRVPDDWEGADFIARHMQTGRQLKVQLKGRMHFGQKYIGKQIWIAFKHGDRCYCYHMTRCLQHTGA